eukprot:Selendium_serpulae@DN2148_c0_g1_i2.p1
MLLGFFKITIGARCVVHPLAVVDARDGPITIGDDVILEENVVIVNNSSSLLEIGDHNLFEVDAKIRSPVRIGRASVFEPKCLVGPRCSVGDGCVVSAGVVLSPDTVVESETVVYRNGRSCATAKCSGNMERHVSTLDGVLPVLIQTMTTFHYLREAPGAAKTATPRGPAETKAT